MLEAFESFSTIYLQAGWLLASRPTKLFRSSVSPSEMVTTVSISGAVLRIKWSNDACEGCRKLWSTVQERLYIPLSWINIYQGAILCSFLPEDVNLNTFLASRIDHIVCSDKPDRKCLQYWMNAHIFVCIYSHMSSDWEINWLSWHQERLPRETGRRADW